MRSPRAVLIAVLCILALNTPAHVIAAGAKPAFTPGTRKAIIYSPLGDPLTLDARFGALTTALYNEGYSSPTKFVDQTGGSDIDPGGATVENFIGMLRGSAGVILIRTHGNPGALLIEWYSTLKKREDRFKSLTGGSRPAYPEGTEGLYRCNAEESSNERFGICISAHLIYKNISDAARNAIIFVAACNSYPLWQAFYAKEFFGYVEESYCSDHAADVKLLFDRLNGSEGVEERTVRHAVEAGGFTTILGYKHLSGASNTTLAPAVTDHVPDDDESAGVGELTKGHVEFDTQMDTEIDPKSVIQAEGCGDNIIKNAQWGDDGASLDFKIKPTESGDATLKVVASKARGGGGTAATKLNGNQEPSGSEATGLGNDNFEWKIRCPGIKLVPQAAEPLDALCVELGIAYRPHTVEVRGDKWKPNSSVTITFVKAQTQVTADGQGKFTKSFEVQPQPAGSYDVKAVGDNEKTKAKPKLYSDFDSCVRKEDQEPGDPIRWRFDGVGFDPGSAISLLVDGNPVDTFKVDDKGSLAEKDFESDCKKTGTHTEGIRASVKDIGASNSDFTLGTFSCSTDPP